MPKQYPPRTHKVAALASSHLAELAELIENEGKKEAKLSDVLYEVAAQIDVMFKLRAASLPVE
jgi:hypothetical protein